MLQARVRGRNFGKALGKIAELDPAGPVAGLFKGFAIDPTQLRPELLSALVQHIIGKKGRFSILGDGGCFVTRHETFFLGWRHNSKGYNLFLVYANIEHEARVVSKGNLAWWEHVPTDSVWQRLTSQEVVQYLEW